jgi:hypothetical protein
MPADGDVIDYCAAHGQGAELDSDHHHHSHLAADVGKSQLRGMKGVAVGAHPRLMQFRAWRKSTGLPDNIALLRPYLQGNAHHGPSATARPGFSLVKRVSSTSTA